MLILMLEKIRDEN